MNSTPSGKEQYCTPPDIIDLVVRCFGGTIALDPCWNKVSSVQATERWTRGRILTSTGRTEKTPEETFTRPWVDYESVYVNPPYGNSPTGRAFKNKIIKEAKAGTHMIICVPANTGTKFFQACMRYGVVKFCSPRVHFIDYETGLPAAHVMHDTALVYFNPRTQKGLRIFCKDPRGITMQRVLDAAEAVQPASNSTPLTDFRRVGYCADCREPQYLTPSGTVCCNGHWGADTLERRTS